MNSTNTPARETDSLVLSRNTENIQNQNNNDNRGHINKWRCKMAIWYLPLLCVVVMWISVVLPYLIAFILHHVVLAADYISAVGRNYPEASIFILLIFLASTINLIMKIIMYVYINNKNSDIWFINTLAFSMGLTACICGYLIVAMPDTKVTFAHVTAASAMFASECFYQIIFTIISWKRSRIYDLKIGICVIRIICNIFSIALVAAAFIAWFVYLTKDMDYETFSQILVYLEFLTPFAYSIYTLSFMYEFNNIEINIEMKEK